MKTFTFYLAGELFSQKHLLGNAYLANAILKQSLGKFVPILPQDLEFRSTKPHAIRDYDLLGLLQSDLALFHFDGPELDSGTVVEFMFAKFADIPSAIIRTDFREGGDQDENGNPWNLMCSFYPRTETIVTSCLEAGAKSGHLRQSLEDYDPAIIEKNLEAQQNAIELSATKITEAFEKLLLTKPVLKENLKAQVYEHLQHFPNYQEDPSEVQRIIDKALKQKRDKGLL